MDVPMAPPVPVLDAGRINRLRNVLAGGHLALAPDRRHAAEILRHWPWAAPLVTGADWWHRRAAAWAVTGGTREFPVPEAAGVIFAACGYPVSGGFHGLAAAERPKALFAYADVDANATAYNRVLLARADPLRVSAYEGSARDPAKLLGSFAARAVLDRGPVQLQLQLCAHWWPAEFCAWVLRELGPLRDGGRLLPPGSTIALSVGIPGGGEGAAAGFTRSLSRAGGALQAHTEDGIAGWVKAAGMELTAPVRDVRAREQGWAAAEFGQQRPAARVVAAVAFIRP